MLKSSFVRNTCAVVLLCLLQTLSFVFLVEPLRGTERVVVLIICVLVIIGLWIGYMVLNYKIMIVPLRDISKMVQKLSKGNYNIRINKNTFDKDIMAINNDFNTIAVQFADLEQMRKQFISNASHELKSPLTSIQGFIQAILDGTILPQDQNKYLNIALGEAKRLTSMIQSMLDLSRIESGKTPMNKTKFELNEVIKRTVLKFEPNLFAKNITIDVSFARERLHVFGDIIRIEQVLTNLIDNAIKYSLNNTNINLFTQINGKKVFIYVKDRGVGISKKDQASIWERFYMVDRSRTPGAGKGTGLGLSIVKKIIDEHGETIWVESNKDGAGTSFIFSLTMIDAGV